MTFLEQQLPAGAGSPELMTGWGADRYISRRFTRQVLSVSESWLKSALKRGLLREYSIGGARRLKLSEVLAFAEAGQRVA